jgi:HemX protein
MATTVLLGAIALYVTAAAAYGAGFARPALAWAPRAGYVLAAAAFVVHAAAIGFGCAESQGRHLLTLAGATGLVGWLSAGVFLVAQRSIRKAAAGAFLLPLIALAAAPEALSSATLAEGKPVLATLPAVGLHVTTAAGGIALFAVAAIFAAMYLLQHRELKGKRFGPLLSRLPALNALDRASRRLVAVGFAVFTIAVASGAVVARSGWCAAWEWDAQLIVSVLVWGVFGALVFARRIGTHGRRQAVATLVAFAVVLTSLVGVRHTGTTQQAALGASELACASPRG